VTGNGLAAPPWCLGCPYPIYDDRKGEWDWYCRQHSPTGIKCSNVAVLPRTRIFRPQGGDTVSSIVLKIPTESQSFRAALTDATLRDRVQEWMAAAVALDDAIYIPLRTDWMPNGTRRTTDGVEVLLAGRWPPEVVAEQGPRISGAVFGRVWEIVCGASGSPDFSGIATCGSYEENNEQSENSGQNEAPEVAQKSVSDEHVLPQNPVADHKTPDSAVEEIYPEGEMDQDAPAARILNVPAEVIEPVISDEVIDGLTLDAGGLDDLTRTVKTLEHCGAKFPPWFCEQPVEVVRAGLKEAARSERVMRSYRLEREDIERRRAALVAQWAIDVGVSLPDPEPAIGLAFPCTDDGNGDRLVAQYRDSIRFCKTFDAWFLWDGSRWERDETCRMLALAKRAARTIHIEASATTDDRREKVGKWALSSGMLSRLKAMIACACPAVAVTPDEFDAHPTLLNCQNGTLELDTLTFREARREDLLTKQAGVAYDPAAACPTWLAHLDLVFGEDTAYIEGFQELCGYSLLQENPEQIMAILYGIGKNGKSVTIGALARVWGDYAVNIAAESLMVRRNDGPRSDLARLHGARLVTASEGESRASLAESVVKQITGDDAITVRRLYENEFQFRPGAKIFLATNHEPRIRGTDEGIWRRLWLLPFTVTIPEGKRDPAILERLEAEGAGILNWCLEGLRRYQENDCRLAPPEKVLAATARFRSESDMVGRFLAQEMKTDPMGTIERTVLYKIYLKWCEDEGEKPVSNRAVIKYLRERGFDERKLGGAMCWTGIRIKSAIEEEEDATAGSVQGGL